MILINSLLYGCPITIHPHLNQHIHRHLSPIHSISPQHANIFWSFPNPASLIISFQHTKIFCSYPNLASLIFPIIPLRSVHPKSKHPSQISSPLSSYRMFKKGIYNAIYIIHLCVCRDVFDRFLLEGWIVWSLRRVFDDLLVKSTATWTALL